MVEHSVGLLSGFWYYIVIFLAVLTVVVFVHELGHYLVARWAGVRVEVFSVGFGKELFGWTARSGTRWRVSLLPFGGYVRMFGEAGDEGSERPLTAEEKAVAFSHKSVGRRAAIVAAGPASNFIFGILLLAGMFLMYGQPTTPAVVGHVEPGSAAADAGVQPGDRILRINGETVEDFQDIQHIVRLRIGEPLTLVVQRDEQEVALIAQPRVMQRKDVFGNDIRMPILGIGAPEGSTEIRQHGAVSALGAAVEETGGMVSSTFTALGQMISGARESTELGGPLRIAKGAGQAAQLGFASIVFFVILLSINLGLINLFPIPMLDGGHLAYYALEAVRGRPLGPRAQEYGFRIGLFLVFALMVFATRNDLVDLKVWEFLRGLTS